MANYEWDSRALLSIILVGLPETKQRLALAKNRSLWSRIHTRVSLPEATPGDTAEYIPHRLRRAGCEREVFNSDAIALIHEQSQGRLRDTDRLATDALKLARPAQASMVVLAPLVDLRPRRRAPKNARRPVSATRCPHARIPG